MPVFLQSWHRGYIPHEKGNSVSHLTNSIEMGGNNTLGDVLLEELKSGSQMILEGTAAVPYISVKCLIVTFKLYAAL